MLMKKLAVWMVVVVGTLGWVQAAMGQTGVGVVYSSGSTPGLKIGVEGSIDPDSDRGLVFHAGAGGFSIPYAGVTTASYREENRFRLGALPAIAVGLVKARAKRHLLVVTWKDGQGLAQAAVFETTKDGVRTLLAILRAHAAQNCPTKQGCIDDIPY